MTFILFLPLVLIIPIAFLSFFANDFIGNILANKNPIVRSYVWHIFFVGMAMAYFEIFYAWARIRMKSIFGNFMRRFFAESSKPCY
ncbi:hypothetical protein [Maribacter confluentis]|uniref:hypothetical protein n=1 Tax=Maribacter confluentis TaxID=1656093 RepID=UPI00345BFD95